MRRTLLLTTLLSGLALSSTSRAEPTVVVEPDATRFKTKTVLDFTEITVSGEVTKPKATLIMGRGRARFRTLIRVRGDFRPELFRSRDNL